MTINYCPNHTKYSINEVIFAQDKLVDDFVKECLVSQTEAFVDTIFDEIPQQNITREQIQSHFLPVKESTKSFVEDLMKDFRTMILKRLEQIEYNPYVLGIRYNASGEVEDVEVSLNFDVRA